MTRDNLERVTMFSDYCHVDVRRIALNAEQIEQYNPPPNPAKVTDSRAKEYIRRHGETSWELDALKPDVIDRLISQEIEQFIDWDIWNDTLRRQEQGRDLLRKVGDNAEAIIEYARTL